MQAEAIHLMRSKAAAEVVSPVAANGAAIDATYIWDKAVTCPAGCTAFLVSPHIPIAIPLPLDCFVAVVIDCDFSLY